MAKAMVWPALTVTGVIVMLVAVPKPLPVAGTD